MLYNESNYIRQLSIDCVIFGYDRQELKVLIPKLKFKGDFWTLPGGFILQEESIDDAAHRILVERTGLDSIFLQQYHVFGEVPRHNTEGVDRLISLNPDFFADPLTARAEMAWLTQRFVSIGYYALVDMNKVEPKALHFDQTVAWYAIQELPPLIMDHAEQIEKALEVLRSDLDKKLLGFNLLPGQFTMKELQHVYETVCDKPFHRGNFQKKMLELGVLERLEKQFTGASNKAPYLYRFRTPITVGA